MRCGVEIFHAGSHPLQHAGDSTTPTDRHHVAKTEEE
jgi:hypothetical protein